MIMSLKHEEPLRNNGIPNVDVMLKTSTENKSLIFLPLK